MCGHALMCVGMHWWGRLWVYAGGIMAKGSLWGGGFCPKCLPQMSIVWRTHMSVILQNLNEIRQSPAEL